MEKIRSASLPHIEFKLPRKRVPHFSIHTRVMQFGLKNSGKFPVFFTLLSFLSILLPYTLSMVKGNQVPLLPLLRHSSSEPMKSGIFNCILYFTAITGSIMVCVRYVNVSSQNEKKVSSLQILNKLGLTSGFACFFGLIVVASFPIISPTIDQLKWDSSVLVPHMMGAFFAFFFGALYLLFQTCITLYFYDTNGRITLLRFTLFMLCAVCSVGSILSTVSEGNKLRNDVYLKGGEIVPVDKPMNQKLHRIGSVCEWLMIFFFCLYFLTFVGESHKISIVLTFRYLLTGRTISIESLSDMSKV